MTNEEARWILKYHRPDRPRSTDRKQLQKAIDVILEDQRPKGMMINKAPYGWGYCSECGKVLEPQDKFCWYCGTQMGGDQNV